VHGGQHREVPVAKSDPRRNTIVGVVGVIVGSVMILLVLFGGGIIPEADISALQKAGVAGIFTPGAPMASITDWLADTLDARDHEIA